MGVFDWLRGKPAATKTDNKTTRFFREKIAERVAAGDVIAIANAASALNGSGTMVFGMVPSHFPGREEVRNEVFEALRTMLPSMPHEQCLAVFDIVARGALPVDVTGRRERWDTERRALVADISTRLGALIETATAVQLVEACVSLRAQGNRVVVLGIEIPRFDSLREQLETRALDRLRALVPTLEGNAGRRVLFDIRNSNLDIHVGTRLAELAEQHRAHVEVALAAVSDEPRNPALDAALDSGDPAAFAVLADWLAERDHPRGALIALQLRAEIDRGLEPDVADHVAAHAFALLGELADYQTTEDHPEPERPAFVWQRGFIDSALLTIDDNVGRAAHSLVELLQLLLAHGSARRLRELRLGVNATHDAGLAELVAILGAHRPQLRKLVLGEFTREQAEISWFIVGPTAGVAVAGAARAGRARRRHRARRDRA
ncbi:MAG TPA: hypothetical protein VH143_34575 [Kofleriaceae bacterium]|nr:hypothetical protein [Kofleriaceae bacterium]